MTRQLPLNLPLAETFGRDHFFVAPANARALAEVDRWRDWPGGKMLISGPKGAGKTHLAHIWAAASGALWTTGAALVAGGQDIAGLAARGALVVDNADQVAGHPEAEAELFHLHNLLVPQGHLLLTASAPPRDWGMALPDLISRMQAAALTPLEAPDDTLLQAVLIKMFSDRQIAVAPNLISWLAARIERSIGAARAVVERLDTAALAMGRPITRQFAAEILGPHFGAGDADL